MSKIKKRVSFSEDVKKNDGLRPESKEFDEYVHNMFNNPDKSQWYAMKKLFLNGERRDFAENLFLRFCDLYNRVRFKSRASVIPCGGGRQNVVDLRHCKFIWNEIQFLRQVLNK